MQDEFMRVDPFKSYHKHDGLHHEEQARRQQHGVEIGVEAVVEANLCFFTLRMNGVHPPIRRKKIQPCSGKS